MAGLNITVPTNFTSVLKDLSFLKSSQQVNMAYRGLYGKDSATSLLNNVDNAVSKQITSVLTRTPEKLTFKKGLFSFVGPGADSVSATGIRAAVPVSYMIADGIPVSLAVSFRKITKVKEAFRRTYPIATFYYAQNGAELTSAPMLCIAAYIDDSNNHRICAWSGSIADAKDNLAEQCSVPVDFASGDIINAVVSRDAAGLVTLVVKAGNADPLTAQFKFAKATNLAAETATEAAVTYGAMNSRTLTSGEIAIGEFWPRQVLTADEMKGEAELLYLRSISRI